MNVTKKQTKVLVSSMNHPKVISKRRMIENLLLKLSGQPTTRTSHQRTITQIHKHMNDLKTLNDTLERRHVAALVSREVRIKNTKL
jgi:hypothetical protein